MYETLNCSFFGENLVRYLLQFIIPCLFSALILIGWTMLLHFPWAWAVQAMVYLQIGLVLFVLYAELDASSVNGAAGWVFLAFCFVQFFLFIGLGILRLFTGGWQVLIALFQ